MNSLFRPFLRSAVPLRPFCSSHSDFQPKVKMPEINDSNATELISSWVKDNKVVLFMKGVPAAPQCGYSKFVVNVLHHYEVTDFKAINILSDEVIRQKVKEFSNWPTYPQLYLNGQLVGGCDIITEMHKDGSLKEMIAQL